MLGEPGSELHQIGSHRTRKVTPDDWYERADLDPENLFFKIVDAALLVLGIECDADIVQVADRSHADYRPRREF